MVLNKKNIFYASDPTKLTEALWSFLSDHDFSNDVVFLPSRRAIRTVEKFITLKSGSAVLLPKLVALGESPDDEEDMINSDDVVSNTERVLVLAKLISVAENRSFASVLPVAHDLIRMQDYIENEQGNNKQPVNWDALIDEKYAVHFQKKAKFLSLIDNVLPSIFNNKITESAKRNIDIRNWIGYEFSGQVIVCGSTASVPATSDLMTYIASLPNGKIILPGKVSDINPAKINICNPYYSEYKFLQKVGIEPNEVIEINVGKSNIDFFNNAFNNSVNNKFEIQDIRFTRIDCARESEEALAVAEIANRSIQDGKSVLVITPDSAGNQRLKEEFTKYNLSADFSGGISGSMTLLGRAILNKIEDLDFDKIENLFEFINSFDLEFTESDLPIIEKIKEVSDILLRHGIVLDKSDIQVVITDALSGVKIRNVLNNDVKINVLGTIESRMQTADVVILTGLNEGMFPTMGYENSWLPRRIAEQIGLPSPQRKISLMALDFITLSCGPEVYWLRSEIAGGLQTTESRFLSRIAVALKHTDLKNKKADDILSTVRGFDVIKLNELDNLPPKPPADRSPVYVTKLDLLIHNPYAFYANHILGLKPKDDWWETASIRDFGILVHDVIEYVSKNPAEAKNLVKLMDEKALNILKDLSGGSVLFHFWHKRFVEMEPIIQQMLKDSAGGQSEIELETKIAGRIVRARADRVWGDIVMDIKTNTVPNKTQLEQGNMPQLPLEAYMCGAKTIQFLQLKNNDIKLIEYSDEQLQTMIDASVQKISELFGRYGKDFEAYEYYETSNQRYKSYDDLARVKD
ncbi:MAG: hypothetical protein GX944_01155 [Alphaproteobacteria bacterium]|nr:hypothetical protein [Alphaproteobacteria bacterium]